jgi:fumarylpyruvate hydrolase
MTRFIFTPPAIAGLPIVNSDAKFPVRRIYCVGRNYAAHAREMGFDPHRDPQFFFCKPNDEASIVPVAEGATAAIPYPQLTENYHHEIELVVAIDKRDRPHRERRNHARRRRRGQARPKHDRAHRKAWRVAGQDRLERFQ